MLSNTLFDTLTPLPLLLANGKNVVTHKNELLLCGGQEDKSCYSYNVLRNEYKLICSYPRNIMLYDHCVVKYNNKDSDTITLLSFGGYYNHTLIMNYVSVWDDENDEKKIENKWLPLFDNKKNKICIKKENNESDYYKLNA
ncbi:hypothetical protein RFI_05423, partial [Reticulomyxa filosa]